MRDLTQDVPADVQLSVFKFRYRERFGLSVSQMASEPWEAIWEADVIWSLDRKREQLEEQRRLNSRN